MSQLITNRVKLRPSTSQSGLDEGSSTKQVLKESGYSTFRLALAFGVAFLADTVGLPFGEAFAVVFDIVIGLCLALILGPRPILLAGFLLEAIPGVGLFPGWIAAVVAIAVRGAKK